MSNRHLAKEGVKHSLKGKLEQVKGTAKASIGELTGNNRLKAAGKIGQVKGEILEAVGKVEQKVARKV